MRIGLFSDTYLPMTNGISYVVELTKRNLEDMGHTVYIFAPKASRQQMKDDSHTIRFRALKGKVYEDDYNSMFFSTVEIQKIKKLKLDVIHFFTPNQVGLLGMLVGLKCKIPVISQYSTDLYQYIDYYPAARKAIMAFPMVAPMILPIMVKNTIKNRKQVDRSVRQSLRSKFSVKKLTADYLTVIHNSCDAVIVLSRKHRTQLRKWSTKSEIVLMPTGVDALPVPSIDDIMKFKKKHSLLSKDKVILYSGRISKEKNLDLLLIAFVKYIAPKHKNIKLMYAGDFDYREELESKANSTNFADRIIFTGRYKRSEAGVIYASADVFAFPSLTDTQGLVIHEAIGAGLPLVLCDNQLSEVFKNHKNGLVAKNNPKDFASKLLDILTNNKLAKSMSKESLEFSSQTTEKIQVENLVELYTRLTLAKAKNR